MGEFNILIKESLEKIRKTIESKHNYIKVDEPPVNPAPIEIKQKIEITFPSDKFLKVIGGIKGTHIKAIETATNTAITLNSLLLTSSSENKHRQIYITGIPSDCEKAKDILTALASGHSEIIKKLEAAIPRITTRGGLYEKVSYYMIPDSYIGFLIGKRGMTIKHIQEEGKSKITIAHGVETVGENNYRRMAIYGTSESVDKTVNLIESKLYDQGYPLTLIEYDPNTPRQVRTFTIPDELIEYIVGDNGEKFLQIVNDSGAQILINPPKSGVSTTRTVSIFGTNMELTMATLMIDNFLLPYAEKLDNNYIVIGSNNLEKYYDPIHSELEIPSPGDPEYPIYMNYYYDYYYNYYKKDDISPDMAHQQTLKVFTHLGLTYIPHMRVLKQ